MLYTELKKALNDIPDLGDRIAQGDGIRKIRLQIGNRSKRHGARVIYYWQVSRDIILMLDVYRKSEKDDLSDAELQSLVKLKRKMLGE